MLYAHAGMVPGWLAIICLLTYLSGLFLVAQAGDAWGPRLIGRRSRTLVYALSLCVYCTSWTFFGSVGLASSRGAEFLPIYIGPVLVIGLFNPFLRRVLRLAKAQNITSIADFVGARYGKAGPVAALVALIAVVGVVPYIALQLKSISASLTLVMQAGPDTPDPTGLAAGVTCVLAAFAIAFGTRRLNATEHQDGLILAIASESIVKLVSFLAVGCFVTWGMFGGLTDLTQRVMHNANLHAIIAARPDAATWTVTTLLAACAILLLPRQFHVAIVENRDEGDVRRAAWLFPLYIVAINLFVIPLAIAGLSLFPEGTLDRDLTVLALPMHAKSGAIVLATLIGGFSAASAMVIVELTALAIMISNDLVVPLLLRLPRARSTAERGDVGRLVLTIRRLSIVAVMGLAFAYFLVATDAALASIGLLSFACIAQILPAFLGGLFWSRATARGASAGLVIGFLVWVYTLLLPSLDPSSFSIGDLVASGPLGYAFLRPTALFGTDMAPLVHGTVFSLAANCLAFIGFSLTRQATPLERLQANVFVGANAAPIAPSFWLWRSSVTIGELQSTVARYIGFERTQDAFMQFFAARGTAPTEATEADVHLMRFAEHLVAASIGAASSRLVIGLLLKRRTMGRSAALQLVDTISAEIQQNRDLLQHAIDLVRQGITLFDRDLRLVFWNREFGEQFELPPGMLRVGLGLDEIIRFNAERGLYGPGPSDEHVEARLEKLLAESEPLRLRIGTLGRVLEVRSARLPDGGVVVTYIDATAQVQSEEQLEAQKETLEVRVRERTDELVRLNGELVRAKAEAEEANLSKTRFLAAASHDILQPLHAARLYASSLGERIGADDGADRLSLTQNVDASLEAVEDILTTLLDISKLDAGALKAEITRFRIDDILQRLKVEFDPMAAEQGLRLTFVSSSLTVASDRGLLRRLLQNLVSNAIKYTPRGRVLVGVRRRGARLRVEVWDTGIGIAETDQKTIFREFARLAPAARSARGVGLGLSIVERISRVLGHKIAVLSTPGHGSVFSVELSLAKRVAASAHQMVTARIGEPQALAGMVIAAIDNEPRIVQGLTALLEGWGCRCVGGADAATVIATLARENLHPDAIIADYHLDESDGIAAVGALREKFGAALPAVIVTADRGDAIREQASNLGARLLHKPLRPAALRALLSQWRVAPPMPYPGQAAGE